MVVNCQSELRGLSRRTATSLVTHAGAACSCTWLPVGTGFVFVVTPTCLGVAGLGMSEAWVPHHLKNGERKKKKGEQVARSRAHPAEQGTPQRETGAGAQPQRETSADETTQATEGRRTKTSGPWPADAGAAKPEESTSWWPSGRSSACHVAKPTCPEPHCAMVFLSEWLPSP